MKKVGFADNIAVIAVAKLNHEIETAVNKTIQKIQGCRTSARKAENGNRPNDKPKGPEIRRKTS